MIPKLNLASLDDIAEDLVVQLEDSKYYVRSAACNALAQLGRFKPVRPQACRKESQACCPLAHACTCT